MSSQQIPSVGRHRHLADSDDSDDEIEHSVLTTAKADQFRPKPYRLVARNTGFASMADMSTFDMLDYVDITGNDIQSLQGLASNFRLKTLIAKHNKLSNVAPLFKHENLQILDISDNSFVTTDWLARAAFAPNLIALIARGNQLVALESLAALRNIQALVVSDNQIEDISPIMQLTTLTKLSASKNQIRIIPDSIAKLHRLRELRLSHNKIAALPAKESLVKAMSLDILDLGHNRITSLDNLVSCASLTQLNIAENPAIVQVSDLQEHVQQLCPSIQVIDGKRFTGGRRKLRVNRQRLEAGLPLEPSRKFARPPSTYYLKKVQNDQVPPHTEKDFFSGEDKVNMPEATEKHVPMGDTKIFDKQSATKRKRNHGQGPEEPAPKVLKEPLHSIDKDSDALDANYFLDMARSRTRADADATGIPASKVTTPAIKKKKFEQAEGRSKKQPIDFGIGGESQW